MHLNIKLVIFSVISGRLKIFLSDDKLPAGKLPGDKPLDKSAEFLFGKNTSIPSGNIYFEQLYTFSVQKPQEIAVVYYFLVPGHKHYLNIKKWYTLNNIRTNNTDRETILYALQRLRWKIEYTNAVYSLLPEEFTFSELQSTYEAILGKTLDKRNFHKKILSLNILKYTGKKRKLGKARPAQLYTFRTKRLSYVTILR